MSRLLHTTVLLLALLLSCAGVHAQNAGNYSGVALASAARTAAQVNSADQINTSWRGAHIVINVSAYTSGNYTAKIQGKDPVSGSYYDILVGAAINSTGTTVLKVYPGITVTANSSASDILPRVWRVQVNGAATPVMAFSVGYWLDY